MVAWATLVTVATIGALALGRPAREGPPLDPASTSPLGTRALVLLAEELGAKVDVVDGPVPGGHDVIVVLDDQLDDAGRSAVQEEQVRSGATLVVADPTSSLSPVQVDPQPAVGLVGEPFDNVCAIPALAGVGEVDPPPGSVAYRLEPGSEGCFHRGGSAFVALAGEGRGTVVAVGGAGVFTNQALGKGDNAVLAAALLVPRPGTRVAILRPPSIGSGDGGLAELVGDNVKAALWQVGLAFGLYALWRARRLGRPVDEPQAVSLEASELVVAVGHLLSAARHHDEAARLVGEDLRRRLAERLGLAGDAPAAEVAEVAAHRSAIPAERILAAMAPPPLAGPDVLVAHVAEAEAIGREVVRA